MATVRLRKSNANADDGSDNDYSPTYLDEEGTETEIPI